MSPYFSGICGVGCGTDLGTSYCWIEPLCPLIFQAFVVLVVTLTTSVVVIFYTCLLPHAFYQSAFFTGFHLIFGHWLLMNIVFNYFMAAFTDPGHSPEVGTTLHAFNPYSARCQWLTKPIQNDAKNLKMTETLAYGYSFDTRQRQPSNEYQKNRVKMVFKNICILVLRRKVASALGG